MKVFTYYLRGNYATIVAESGPEAMTKLRREKGLSWATMSSLVKVETLTWDNLPAQPIGR
jgi:hypothetical protein